MNAKIVKYLAYGIGGVVLLAGSFFLFAAMAGTPMSDLPGVGGAFPDEGQPAAVSRQLPHPQDELEGDRRSEVQVLGDSLSPLKAFMLPSGFSAGELSALEQALELRMAEVERRARDLEQREYQLEQDRLLYDGLFAELEGLRSGLLEHEAEQEARAEELARDADALQARRRADFAKLAPLYANGRVKEQAAMLVGANEPEDAALILAALPTERVAELITAIYALDVAKASSVQKAYLRAVADGPPAK